MSAVSPEEIRAGLKQYERIAHMNDQVARHQAVCDELNKLYERKNHDYGDSFHKMFMEEGMGMCRIRLGDKLNRFKTLSKGQHQQVTDESIRDTLLDLANYAIMTVLELDESNQTVIHTISDPIEAAKLADSIPMKVHALHQAGLAPEEIGHRLKISIDAVRTLIGDTFRD